MNGEYYENMHITVKVAAGAARESLKQLSEHGFAASVRERPRDNAANERVIALVAARYRLPSKKVRIVKGYHSPSKILSVDLD